MLFLKAPTLKTRLTTQIASHRIYILGGLVLSILLIIIALAIANTRTSSSGRAGSAGGSISSGKLSPENSYLFASPISAEADGSSPIRITVILLDAKGLGVVNQLITLKSSGNTIISPIQPMTDNFGRAIFDVISNSAGDHTINAEASGVSLSQTVSMTFR